LAAGGQGVNGRRVDRVGEEDPHALGAKQNRRSRHNSKAPGRADVAPLGEAA
jgi:hypothetical protein